MGRRRERVRWAWLVWAAAGLSTAALAETPAQKCAAAKKTAAGQYAECRHEAAAKFALVPSQSRLGTDLARCTTTLRRSWTRAETQYGGACPTTGDAKTIEETTAVETGVAAGALASSITPLLSGFRAVPLQTGQTTCFANATTPIRCADTGQDGDLRHGIARGWVDNGDGTITDTTTSLTWEKESDDGSIHDGDAWLDWNGAFAKIAALNATAFAGHTDWRLPNVIELQSLADYGAPIPNVPPVFHTGCVRGCTVLTCSCTRLAPYWTSTTTRDVPDFARQVDFRWGLVGAQRKSNAIPVRAVRGGL